MGKLIICFDVDGTLVNSNRRIHPADVKVFSSNLDCIFIPSTGRTLSSLRLLFKRNGLYVNQPIPFPMILQNGTAVYGEAETLLSYSPFEPEIQKELIHLLSQYCHVNHLFMGLNEIYLLNENEDEFGAMLIKQFDLIVEPFSNANLNCRFSKVMCLSPTPAHLEAIRAQLNNLPVESALSLSSVLEITPGGINKATGFNQLRNIIRMEGALICAIGDGENDLPIFEVADYSFAPQTSPGWILKRVNHVVDAHKNGIFTPILEAVR